MILSPHLTAMNTPDKMMFCAASLAAIGGVRHGFFTREGGVSGGIYASLNCGPGSRDAPANVRENRARVAARLDAAPARLLSVFQKHSAKAVIADGSWGDAGPPEADALVTATPGLALGILTADCAPVLFCDPEARVIGAAHAGWRGALFGIVEATIAAMESLGASRANTRAVIGPAISQKAYQVGHDYQRALLAEDPAAEPFFVLPDADGAPHFNLSGYVASRLARAEVGTIADLGICTYCEETALFSYRRSQHRGEPDYGRQISAIVLA